MRTLICLCLLAVVGCVGPSNRDRAISQVETLAENVDLDAKATDPWGNDIIIKVTKSSTRWRLEVRSCGPDGLPFTRDDIVAARWWRVPEEKSRIERGSEDFSRGFVNGVKQGLKKK